MRLLRAFLLVGFLSSSASAQGVQTGDIRGLVTDPSGAVVPDVAVAVTSPALQGERSTATDGEGGYILPGLPPGTYVAVFRRAGFASAERTIEVPLGSVVQVDLALTAEPVTEQVAVVGQAENVVRQTQVAVNITKDLVDRLPIGRSPFGIASTMPGLTTNTFNAGQLAISGSFGYDNLFLVDGADINDNLFGTADALYIEDAIEETQVLTGGISAEYGRFSGGIVNVISRRGGNAFSASFRETWSNPAWVGRTPFETKNGTPHTSELNTIHEGTFGGPIARDRVWFFAAGRFRQTDNDETFAQTGLPYKTHDENKRGQIRLTATFANNHTVSGQYLNNSSTSVGPSIGFQIDPSGLVHPHYPNDQFVTVYRGTLRSKAFLEVQYSQKNFGFRDAGGSSPDRFDSPIVNSSPLGIYNAPYFDASDPEDRNNKQIKGNLSYFLSKWGHHDLKGGGEYFKSTNTGGNSQTSTGYVFEADYLTDAAGNPVFDSTQHLIPTFVPGETVIENWLPVRGATIDIKTTSLYAQDRWSLDKHWSVDLGTRFERVRSHATGGLVGLDTTTMVPRLAVSFDPRGDGTLVFSSTYGHYAGKYGEAQFSRNTNVGNPDVLFGVYAGPVGQGRNFAAGFNPANYVIVDGEFPTANVFFDDGLSSPITKELTLQAGARIGRKAYAKLVYSNRRVKNFVEDFVTRETGSTLVSKGGVSDVFSNVVYRNSDLPTRNYQALELFGRYMPTSRWTWNAAWTMQLKNEGSFVGESSSQPGISSPIGDYPEAFNEQRHYPIGRLPAFQRHTLNVWSIYSVDLGRFGGIDFGGFLSGNSPLTYSLRAAGQPLTSIQHALLSGYVSQPSSQTIYFGPRGSEEFKGYSSLDAAITYSIPVFRSARPWIKLEIFNVFDNEKLVTWNTTVRPDPASPRDSLGLATGYIKGPQFGQAQSNGNYLEPRGFRAAFGIRF